MINECLQLTVLGFCQDVFNNFLCAVPVQYCKSFCVIVL